MPIKVETAAALMRDLPEAVIPENVKFYQTRRNPVVGERTVYVRHADTAQQEARPPRTQTYIDGCIEKGNMRVCCPLGSS